MTFNIFWWPDGNNNMRGIAYVSDLQKLHWVFLNYLWIDLLKFLNYLLIDLRKVIKYDFLWIEHYLWTMLNNCYGVIFGSTMNNDHAIVFVYMIGSIPENSYKYLKTDSTLTGWKHIGSLMNVDCMKATHVLVTIYVWPNVIACDSWYTLHSLSRPWYCCIDNFLQH